MTDWRTGYAKGKTIQTGECGRGWVRCETVFRVRLGIYTTGD